jgi:hypothetical protein
MNRDRKAVETVQRTISSGERRALGRAAGTGVSGKEMRSVFGPSRHAAAGDDKISAARYKLTP